MNEATREPSERQDFPPARPMDRHLPWIRGWLRVEAKSSGLVTIRFFSIWATGLWVLLLFPHPAAVIALAAIYAFLAPAKVAGRDALDGSEEIAFSLPIPRSGVFLLRLSWVGLPLAIYLAVGLLAIERGWPQALWGLVVETGFADPFPPARLRAGLRLLSLAAPFALLAWTFSLAILARTPRQVGSASAGSILVVGLLLGAGLWLEGYLRGWPERLDGRVATPILLASAAAILIFAHFAYLGKEPGGQEGAARVFRLPGFLATRAWTREKGAPHE